MPGQRLLLPLPSSSFRHPAGDLTPPPSDLQAPVKYISQPGPTTPPTFSTPTLSPTVLDSSEDQGVEDGRRKKGAICTSGSHPRDACVSVTAGRSHPRQPVEQEEQRRSRPWLSSSHPQAQVLLTSTCNHSPWRWHTSAIIFRGSNAPRTVVPEVALTRNGTAPYCKNVEEEKGFRASSKAT